VHLIWQTAKCDVERINAFGSESHEGLSLTAHNPLLVATAYSLFATTATGSFAFGSSLTGKRAKSHSASVYWNCNYHSSRHFAIGGVLQSKRGQIAIYPGAGWEAFAWTERNRDACHKGQFQTGIGLRSSEYPTPLFEA